MRYKLPDGCVSVTLAGAEITARKDRTIEAEATFVADLAPHGIVPVEDEAPARAAADRRMLR